MSFCKTSVALSMIQKQFTPVFLAIPSQYSLKCLVISLRLDVSSWDKGLALHALEIHLGLGMVMKINFLNFHVVT